MTKSILDVAVIGCGRVAGHHIRSVQQLPSKFRLVAVCDQNPERCAELATLGKVPGFVNYFEMLEKHPEVDVVSVITPSGMHFEHSLDVMTRFNKSVVVEKPVVMTLEQGRLLAETAKATGTRVFPVFQYRFNRSVQRLRKAMQGDELGNLVLATVRTRWCRPQRYYDRDAWRGTFALDGGACTNQGIHHIDLLRYLVGEVKSVNAKMGTYGAKIEVEDTVTALLEFERGGQGIIEITTAARPDDFESSISVVGNLGLAMVGGWATNELIRFSPNAAEEKIHSEQFADVYGFGHKDIYSGVYAALVEGGAPAVEYPDAFKSIQLLNAIYRSDELKGWVNVASAEPSVRLGKPDGRLSNLYRTSKK